MSSDETAEVDIPEVKYARSGRLRIAYQRFGSGPDVVYVPPLVSNVELWWEHPTYRRVMEYHAPYLRVLQFDKRGIGCSDSFEEMPTLEERIADITAVMDAENIERASLLGMSEGALMAQLFAAEHPERVDRLVLANPAIGLSGWNVLQHCYGDFVEPNDPVWDAEGMLAMFDRLPDTWGEDPRLFFEWMMPSQLENESLARWTARLQRQSASPADITRQIRSVLNLDGPPDYGAITAPTLVIQVAGDKVTPAPSGRWLAKQLPNSTYVEFEGSDHFLWTMPNWRDIVDAVIGFVAGQRPQPATTARFAVVLFTDVVGSTAATASAGDTSWRETMDAHDRLCQQVVDRYGGRIVKSTGDGMLAVFDAPSAGVTAAAELVADIRALGLTIRAGLHAGEVRMRDDGDVSGLAVNLAARIEQVAEPGSVYVSSTLRDLLLGGDLRFDERGEHELKGIESRWRLYALDRQ